MIVENVVKLTDQKTSSAIQVGQSLQDDSLLSGYAMTDSAAKVFNHISEAVLPQASADQRAINIYGSYGSGKSHLAVVLSRLLRDGATDPGFASFISRLENSSTKFGPLADKLTSTFLGRTDTDAHPYFVLNLYAVEAPSIAEQLIGALVSELEKYSEIDSTKVLPTTQHEVCLKRINEIESFLTYEEKDFYTLGIKDSSYFNLDELKRALEDCDPDSLESFQKWHKAVTMGQLFDPLKHGGADLIEVYLHAGEQLAKHHGYAGILVVWDEFGSCLEDFEYNPDRNLLDEVVQLQRFVESTCSPKVGHTIFVGVTHVTLQEYSQRLGFDEKSPKGAAFEKIAGRFNGNHPFGIRLSAGEKEGYHLIGMQREWTEEGKVLREQSQENKQHLITACRSLDSFAKLSQSLETLVDEVYPLHPTTALTLFNLSKLSQASRTALSFLKLHKDEIFYREVGSSIWTSELVRIDAIVDYFSDELSSKNEYKLAFQNYSKSVNSLVGSSDEIKQQTQILSLLFLSSVLGEALKPTEEFLSCALYDSTSSMTLHGHLESLRLLGVVWQNDVNKFWQLAGDSSLNIDQLIRDKVNEFPHRARSVHDILIYQPDLRETFLPTLGEFELAPNQDGIIHSYNVLMAIPDEKNFFKPNLNASATIKLVFADSGHANLEIESNIAEENSDELYFWLPNQSLNSASKRIGEQSYQLPNVLSSYWACTEILSGESVSGSARIQVEIKSEFFRSIAKDLILDAFGAQGLQKGVTKVLKAGSTGKVEIKSWMALNRIIVKGLASKYTHPVSVRAANVNILSTLKPYKKEMLSDIVERVLSFDSNNSYQTKYLGHKENSQGLCTSEAGAIMNGVVSLNSLIKPTVDGFRLARPEELKDGTGELVSELQKALTAKKQDGIKVYDIATKYNRAPHGVPRTVLPIFMAFAIRDVLTSLKWSGCPTMATKDFAKKLVEECYKQSNTLRYADFNARQKMLLREAAKIYDISYSKNSRGLLTIESYEKIAKAFVLKLKDVPDSVLSSDDVSASIKKFIQNLKRVGVSTHETIVEFIKVIEIQTSDDGSEIFNKLASFKELFERANDAILYQIRDKLDPFNSLKSENYKWQLISSTGTTLSRLVVAYSNITTVDAKSLKVLIEKELSISFDKYTETDLQRTLAGLETLFETASNFVPSRPEPEQEVEQKQEIEQEVEQEPDINVDRKSELSAMVEMIWPLIEGHGLKPQTLDEIEFFVGQLRDKGKQGYGN
ncbi:DUF6079 family protein [Shewanella sp. 5_MG-2023]|uniref:DUF6079 family protein n=1 Tax=Shewanella sp. 5_MG-2023 TaxID=3062656 RepID=UPI0026E1B4CC|nr:DUF6079 family protein [Shewanella sp. 5_MG-2023]MDO6639756.1 DUF6079 family protein [Shewanella sp. 5_MG-2023]